MLFLLFTKRRKCYNPPSFGSVDFVDVVHRDYLPFRKNRFKILTLQIAPWRSVFAPHCYFIVYKVFGCVRRYSKRFLEHPVYE
jgi:hypothetical protein